MDLSYLAAAGRQAGARPARLAVAIGAVLGVTLLDVLSAQQLGQPNSAASDLDSIEGYDAQ